MKPVKEIMGNLGHPVEVGYRAFIKQEKGTMLFTSQVVDVRNETKTGMEIETRNTIYKLTFDKENLPLAGQSFTKTVGGILSFEGAVLILW